MNALNIGLTKDYNLTTDIYQEHSKLIQVEGEHYIIRPEYFNGKILLNHNLILQSTALQNGDLLELASLKFIWNSKIAFALAIIPFAVKNIISIGRSSQNALIINDPIVSDYHACIIHTLQNEFYIIDFNEGIGTYLNGVPVKIARLNPAHTLVLGTTPYNWQELFAKDNNFKNKTKQKAHKNYLFAIFITLLLLISFLSTLLQPRSHSSASYAEAEEQINKSKPPVVLRKLSNAPVIAASQKNTALSSCPYQVELSQLLEACNYQHPVCRDFALTAASEEPGTLNIGQICSIYDKVCEKWKYVEDPFSGDLLNPASVIMNNKWIGDCEDFGITLAAALMATGFETRLVKAYHKDEAHAYLEVNIGTKDIKAIRDYIRKRYDLEQKKSLAIRKDEVGNSWLNLDWSAEHPGGKYFEQDHGIFFYLNQQTCKEF